MALARVSLIASIAWVSLACGSDPVDDPANGGSGGTGAVSGGTAGRGGASGRGGSGGEPVTCEEGPNYYEEGLPKQELGIVEATLLSDGDDPAFDVPVYLCGVDVCSPPGFSDEAGDVSVRFATPVTKPAFKYGDGLVHAELAILLEGDDGVNLELGELYSPRMPEAGAPIGAGLTSESNGVAITLADDAVTDVEELLPPFATPDAQAFRAVEIPVDALPEGVLHGEELELVFGLAPLGATLCPAARLAVPNSEDWEPGTEVEFLLEGFGVIDEQRWAPYGEWGVFAEGEVSADGESIVTLGDGLPLISNVGVRRK
jgi:hypothetical protein